MPSKTDLREFAPGFSLATLGENPRVFVLSHSGRQGTHHTLTLMQPLKTDDDSRANVSNNLRNAFRSSHLAALRVSGDASGDSSKHPLPGKEVQRVFKQTNKVTAVLKNVLGFLFT